jgi:hypothetical protein
MYMDDNDYYTLVSIAIAVWFLSLALCASMYAGLLIRIKNLDVNIRINNMKLSMWDSMIYGEEDIHVNDINNFVERDNVIYLTPPDDEA